MKILFVSNLYCGKSHGPSWSVPARIKSQEKIDDVLWINCTDAYLKHWGETKTYHNIKEFGGKLTLTALPTKFQLPDVVVFEDVYYWHCWRFHKELLKKRIPYVIVPRGSLTMMAQNNSKKVKKKIANFLLFTSFIRKAVCIQYLTQEEYRESTDKWNNHHIIIPNGFILPTARRESFSYEGINAIFIGRLNAYHKGLDLLIEACKKIHKELSEAHFSITLYGELNRDYEQLKKLVEVNKLSNIITFKGEIFGQDKEMALLNADLFVMTSRFEGLPMALLEALAYGIPVLATQGTNMADSVKTANAGWTTSTNIDAIATSLLRIINERTELKQKGENARKLAQQYEWDKLATEFHTEIKSILDKIYSKQYYKNDN